MLQKTLDYLMKFLVFLTVSLWILAIFYPELIKDFIEWVKWIVYTIWNWNYVIVFLSSLIEGFPVLWVVIPWQNILLIVGWFFAEININNLIFVMIIASLGAIISNYIGYFLWKYYWETFFKKYGLWFGIWETEVNYLKKWIKKWWPWGIIIGKFHNVARAFIPFIAWSMNMKHKSFFVYNVLWSVLRAITMILLWVVFAQYYEILVDYMLYIMMWVMIIVWIYIYRYKKKEFIQYIKDKNEELDRKM